MTGLDIVVLVVVGIAAIGGFMRGFVQEVLSLAALVLAVLAIRYLHTDLTQFLAGYVGGPGAAAVLAFMLLSLVPYLVVKLAAARLGRASRRSVIGPFDRVLGFGFGMVKGVIIVVFAFSLLVLAYDTIWGPKGRPDWIRHARTYTFIDAASEALVQVIEMRRERLQEEDAVVPEEN
jgi:membrane protein required for colicin V production